VEHIWWTCEDDVLGRFGGIAKKVFWGRIFGIVKTVFGVDLVKL